MPNLGKIAMGLAVGSLVGLGVGGASWTIRSFLGPSFVPRWWYEPLIAAAGGALAGLVVTQLPRKEEGAKSTETALGLLVPALGAAVIPLVEKDQAILAGIMILGILACIFKEIQLESRRGPAVADGKFQSVITTLGGWEVAYKLPPDKALRIIEKRMSLFFIDVHRSCGPDREHRDRVARD